MDKQDPTIDFQPIGRRIAAEPGQTILAAARQHGMTSIGAGIAAPCGGRGTCGRCRVRVAGEAAPPTEAERRLLSATELAAGFRLACQAVPLGPVRVEVPPETMLGISALQVSGDEVTVRPQPPVQTASVRYDRPDVQQPVPFWQQAAAQLVQKYGLDALRIDLDLARRQPAPPQSGEAQVTLRGQEVVNVHFGPRRPSLGLAVDLGTTKIAGFLVDLETGLTMASEGLMNPQISYGEDVMARMAFALEGEANYERIVAVVAAGLNSLAAMLASQAGVGPEAINEAVIVGNTAMHHLLLRLPLENLARAPYVPVLTAPVEVKARELGLTLAPGAYAYLPPVVAGFVGGDHVAMILGSRLDEYEGVALGLDIGTNTEIVLAHAGKLISCSCASGPAFEGAHIQHGMRAVSGAIASLELQDGGQEVAYATIGGAPPLGLCGSAVLDLVAELYRHGIVNQSGRLQAHARVRRDAKGRPEFLLVPAPSSGTGQDITFTQRDIGEIQLAKGAIATGANLLLQAAGLQAEQVERVVMAGAFGTHLNLASALAVGMLPDLPRERFHQVGNAAGTGARLCLYSLAERRRAEAIAGRSGYLELMAVPGFNDAYIGSLNLPERPG